MNCNSNPRDFAYKRNYRCSQGNPSLAMISFVLLCSLLSTANAFGVNVQQQLFVTTPSSTISMARPLLSKPVSSLPNARSIARESSALAVAMSTAEATATLTTPMETDVTPSEPVVTPEPSVRERIMEGAAARAPGVALSVAIAQVSMTLAKTPLGHHICPLLWATILGMAYGNLLHRPIAKETLSSGIKFAKGRLLRLGIILYGFKLTLQQIAGVGFAGLATDAVIVASTLTLGIRLGTSKWFNLDKPTATLIGSGAAICGCSAVLATQPVVGGECHQVSAAVGTVVVGGTLSMFLYPFLYKAVPFLAASPKLMGVYAGSTIHEIAGVMAAGNAMGGEVALTATVTKLARVLLLAPVLTTLSWLKNRESKASGAQVQKAKVTLPWFAFAFIGISAINSMVTLPASLIKFAGKTSAFALVCAMAALGIDSDFAAIRKLGSKPLILATVLWTWLTVGGLGIARLFVGA